ncbi:MAG: hypothetical protein ABI203_09165 [Mucilaginibacter sp.]
MKKIKSTPCKNPGTQKSHSAGMNGYAFSLSGFTGSAFLTLCGRVLPNEPIAIFPLAVFLSPLPMIVVISYLLNNQYYDKLFTDRRNKF